MRVGILGDVNLNLIDGSSLWVHSLADGIKCYTSHTPVVISKCLLDFDRPIPAMLKRSGIVVVGPEELGAQNSGKASTLLAGNDLSVLNLDVLLVRDADAALTAIDEGVSVSQIWAYVANFDRTSAVDDNKIKKLRKVCLEADRLLLQTPSAREFVAEIPGIQMGKIGVLPPMVPDRYISNRPVDQRKRRILYGGKYDRHWGILELGRIAHDISQGVNGLKPMPIVLFGDKIHDPTPGRQYAAKIEELRQDPLLEWRGAAERDRVVSELQNSRYAWAWRTAELEEATLETSSKVLEACAAGALPICYPKQSNVELLGADYPLFAKDPNDALIKLQSVDNDLDRLAAEQVKLRDAVARHRSRVVIKELFSSFLPVSIPDFRNWSNQDKPKPKLRVAGHDLKFTSALIRNLRLTHSVEIERWRNHDDAERKALPVDKDVNIIWAEWCLGAAVHYSKRKRSNQILVVRFHSQEFFTPFPQLIDIENVDKVVFVNRAFLEKAQAEFGWPREKLALVPSNYIEPNAYYGAKSNDAYFNIGLVGCVPKIKRLDRAIDLLESLRRKDDRWMLWIKGARPSDYEWMKARQDEMEFYEECYRRVRLNPDLNRSIRFVSSGTDVPLFLRDMGWILSPSDHEGSHVSVAEGAAANAVPVIWRWAGVESVYDDECIVDSTDEAFNVMSNMTLEEWRGRGLASRERTIRRFSVNSVADQLRLMFCPVAVDSGAGLRNGSSRPAVARHRTVYDRF